jgi:Na+/H+ antiporter NhaA
MRSGQTPRRRFVRTETGGAAVLLAGVVVALAWANAAPASYNAFWAARVAVQVAGTGLSLDLQDWVNSGLMSFFFLVAGLEVRREFDVGELRDRQRLALPVAAGLGGMIVPVTIYLAFNAGRPSAHGWGTAMSTDTAFALGMLALAGPRLPDRVRAYLVTFSVVDDIVALAIIAFVYSGGIRLWPLLAGLGVFGLMLLARAAGVSNGIPYFVSAVGAWIAFAKSGVSPVVVGLFAGLTGYAYPSARSDLERASQLFRLFREQPTAELAASARESVRLAIPPNDRLQRLYQPWTSYLIVPVFALANAGIEINGGFLARAFAAPVTLGILVGYVAGKPAGTVAATWLVTWASRGRIRPPVGWGAVAGTGMVAGIGFTVSLLIASLAFHGTQLAEAKLGVLTAALCASGLTWATFRLIRLLPRRLRNRLLLGTAETIIDLAVPVDPRRDHIRGSGQAPVTVVEYGDFECPYCGQAEPAVRQLLAEYGDEICYVWRHLPLTDVHPHAQLAAEASEAAAAQGKFWEMHDMLLDHQDALENPDLARYAAGLGLDTERFASDLRNHAGAARIAQNVDSADLSRVAGTPTFFINGRRHHGRYDLATLSAAVLTARSRAAITA